MSVSVFAFYHAQLKMSLNVWCLIVTMSTHTHTKPRHTHKLILHFGLVN